MLIFVYLYIMLIALVCSVEIYIEVQYYIKERCVIFIYLMTEGKAFAIIIKVVQRKFEKQKYASLNWSILSEIRNHFSKKEFHHFPF